MSTTLATRSQTKLSREQKAWLKALRSGEYTQGSMRMRNLDESMCCLGVLCDVIDPEGWTVIQSKTREIILGDSDLGYAFGEGEDHETTQPPEWIKQLVGIAGHGVVGDLVNLNDALHWTFDQIADWLERYWILARYRLTGEMD